MTLHIDLPDEVRERLSRRAAENGYSDVQEYAQALLRADVEEDFLPEEVEELLLERLKDTSPRMTLTPTSEAEFRAEVARRRNQGGTPQ
ncbi:MAG TPA: hypothetical protein VG722_06920 [Tepidisphaeraceae bacterium]|nr:hypothetical protein [Tepidisphaeraceae bacterium]